MFIIRKAWCVLQATCLIALISTLGGKTLAASIIIDREITFDNHQVLYVTGTDQTFVRDTYTIDSSNVDLGNNSYDSLQVTLSVGLDKLFVVDDVGSEVSTRSFMRWLTPSAGASILGTDYQVQYSNGSGNLPAPNGIGFFGMAQDGGWIAADGTMTSSTGGFSFNAITMSDSFGPYNSNGVYEPTVRMFQLYYYLPGRASDPGRFSHIIDSAVIPIPSAAGVGLIGFGLLGVMRRRIKHK